MFRGKALFSSWGQKNNALFYNEDAGSRFLRIHRYLSYQVTGRYNIKDTDLHLTLRLPD